MDCLQCGTEMTNTSVQTRKAALSYDMFDTCGSLWLDAGELDKLAFQVKGSIEYSSIEPTPGSSKRRKNCPRCAGIALDRVHFLKYTELVLDRCSSCGGFRLDGGEL